MNLKKTMKERGLFELLSTILFRGWELKIKVRTSLKFSFEMYLSIINTIVKYLNEISYIYYHCYSISKPKYCFT